MIAFRSLIVRKKGMTLPEVLMSLAIGMFLLGIVLSMWYFAYRNWTLERIQTKLRVNLQIAMEQIKEELRLSSATYISLYKPSGDVDYRAISFPQATPDGNGLFTLAGDKIEWDKSVIYHIYDNSGNIELRKTTFTDNNTYLIDNTLRELQLISVVTNGDGSSAANSANATTQVVFENLVDLTISPRSQEFDGYSATTKRSDNVEFGSVRLEPGNHTFRFEAVDQNVSSTGFAMGIDTFSITPSGCVRETEFHIPPFASSGDSVSKVYAEGWSGDNYLEFSADALNDYIAFQVYYDLWRETNFDNSIKENTVLTSNDLYLKLALPKEGGGSCWEVNTQTGADSSDYPGPGVFLTLPVSIRNILSADEIETDGDLVRVKFVAHSGLDFVISQAWITERAADDDGTGVPVRLYFSDAPVAVGSEEPDDAGEEIGDDPPGSAPTSITIPADNYAWSNWAAFTIDETKDYFVTFTTPSPNFVCWIPTDTGVVNSYYSDLDGASTNVWANSASSHIVYAMEEAANWVDTGTVTSKIYDSKLSNPGYNALTWAENKPAGTTVVVKARSSDDEHMTGATDWASIPDSTISNLNGRYVQFRAELGTSAPYDEFPWIDNVTIDWPGEAKICDISGYFTQKPNYGIIRITVDGQELTKGLYTSITVYDIFQGDTYEVSLSVETEPRNTGR